MVKYIKESIEDDSSYNNKKTIKGATLLSVNEYKRYIKIIPKRKGRWWLRTPGNWDDEACYAYQDDAKKDYYYCKVNDKTIYIRPALVLNSRYSKFNIGEKINFDEYSFTVISKSLAICDDFIGRGQFNDSLPERYANDYNSSDVKKFIDNWFNNACIKHQ